jgi:polyhydroxyalkanoate synthase subunit PhaC
VINPPAANKRNYWIAPGTAESDAADGPAQLGSDPGQWFAAADQVPGSWWPAWAAWLAPNSGPQVTARKKLGNAEYAVVEPAPGSYVREKAT